MKESMDYKKYGGAILLVSTAWPSRPTGTRLLCLLQRHRRRKEDGGEPYRREKSEAWKAMIEGLDALLWHLASSRRTSPSTRWPLRTPPYTNEHPNSPSYDRLEFLGDAVLDLVIASYAYKKLSDAQFRPAFQGPGPLVEGKTLTDFSENRFGFAGLVRYSVGEKGNTRFHKHINEDIFEAFIGAVYLDQGFAFAERLLLDIYVPSFPTSSRNWTIPIRRAVSKKSSSATSTMSASTRRTSTPRMSATSSRRG